MKKSAALLLMFILSITMLSGSSYAARIPNIVPLNDEEARRLLQMWLDDHPFDPPAVLAREHQEHTDDDGDAYYLFSLDDMQRYWLNFLVNKDTGDLFFMMISDGEEVTIEIEPLDDWYKKNL